VAPKIDRRNLRDVTLSAGASLKYDVNVIGEPPPTIDWRFGACPLRSGKNVSVDNVDYNTKLVIRPVKREDSGEYTITAKNSSGTDSVTVNVTVTDKPGPPEGPLQVSIMIGTWIRHIEDYGLVVLHVQRFRCRTFIKKDAN